MVQVALAKAQEMNIKLRVAVCDAGGHRLAFNRMEGAILRTYAGSIWLSRPSRRRLLPYTCGIESESETSDRSWTWAVHDWAYRPPCANSSSWRRAG
jgi:Haem-degrading